MIKLNIYQMYPILEGVERRIYDIDRPITITRQYTVARETKPGWIVAAQVDITGSDEDILIIRTHTKLGRQVLITAMPKTLKRLGLVGLASIQGSVLVNADDEAGYYSMILSPQNPIPYFASESYPIEFIIYPKTQTTINGFSCELLIIEDIEALINSLRNILTIEVIKELEKTLLPRFI